MTTRDTRDDRHFDAYVAAKENHDFRSGDPAVLKIEHDFLIEAGLLEPDEPTRWSHYIYTRRITAEFTPAERAHIRAVLGMGP